MPMHHHPSAQQTFKPALLAAPNVYLQDIFNSSAQTGSPISCGLYRLEKGPPLVYTYTYEEMKIIIEGEFEISDETGLKVTARPGDVFWFEKGAVITFTTKEYGLAFYTGQRGQGEA
ncbi:putative ethanolamine utilization protein [Choiromyces venosus 120613-1]|uniref:Putative ethanolamine utilization protein n=1 Tax=Choiromyces venosus 120613-1 TaxID=1336337 RepID=A0A3N4JPE5_9PEZI|nr:putative ethanolamine utilization protein [Choiromyces venosus 120613-1]